MAKRAKPEEGKARGQLQDHTSDHTNDKVTIAMLRRDLERAQNGLERAQEDLERAEKDAQLLDSERLLGLGHLRRYHAMLENNDAYVCCTGCGQFWHESSLGVGGNPALCRYCNVFCCAVCSPDYGCECEKEPEQTS